MAQAKIKNMADLSGTPKHRPFLNPALHLPTFPTRGTTVPAASVASRMYLSSSGLPKRGAESRLREDACPGDNRTRIRLGAPPELMRGCPAGPGSEEGVGKDWA